MRPSSLVETGFEPETETYENACKVLHSITFGTLRLNDYGVRRSGVGWGFDEAVPYCLSLLGYTVDELDRLSPIQITATKGKGSTAAFTANILQHLGKHADGRPVKIGCFTGPHFVTDRDQIAINGLPVSEELFNHHFWRLWNRLRAAEDPTKPASYRKPTYLFFIFCLGMIIFLEEGVDVAVIEVFCGGRSKLYDFTARIMPSANATATPDDTTSIIKRPLVVSVGSIGLDHIGELGDCEEAIAFEKAGLYKPDCAAVTIRQKQNNWNAIIEKEARKANVLSLTVLEKPFHEIEKLSLGIPGNKSALNASLAVTIVQAFLAHPRRPSAFMTVGRALRRPRAQHGDLAHSSSLAPHATSSLRKILARAMPSTSIHRYTMLFIAIVACIPLIVAEQPKRNCVSFGFGLFLRIPVPHYTIAIALQVILLLSHLIVHWYNSYSRRSAWKNPLLLDASIPSIRVSKRLVSSRAVAEAVQSVRFPGRGDIVPDTRIPSLTWLMHAAHTPCSMPVQAVWANSIWAKKPKARRLLIVMVEPYRPARKMFDAFLQASPESYLGTHSIDHVLFCNDVVYRSSYQYDPDMLHLDKLEKEWRCACDTLRLKHSEKTYMLPTFEDAVHLARALATSAECAGGIYALTFGIWPGDLHLAAGLPVDFGRGCMITPT